MDFLKDHGDGLSSKRLFSLICLITAIWFTIKGVYGNVSTIQYVVAFLSASVTLQTASAYQDSSLVSHGYGNFLPSGGIK